MPFDIIGAKKAGFSDKQIADELGKGYGFNTALARKNKFTDQEIIGEILSKEGAGTYDPEAAINFQGSLNPIKDIDTRNISGKQQEFKRDTTKTAGAAVAKTASGLVKGATLGIVDPSKGTINAPLVSGAKIQTPFSLNEFINKTDNSEDYSGNEAIGEAVGSSLPYAKVTQLAKKIPFFANSPVIREAIIGGTSALAAPRENSDNLLMNTIIGTIGGGAGGAAESIPAIVDKIRKASGDAKLGFTRKQIRSNAAKDMSEIFDDATVHPDIANLEAQPGMEPVNASIKYELTPENRVRLNRITDRIQTSGDDGIPLVINKQVAEHKGMEVADKMFPDVKLEGKVVDGETLFKNTEAARASRAEGISSTYHDADLAGAKFKSDVVYESLKPLYSEIKKSGDQVNTPYILKMIRDEVKPVIKEVPMYGPYGELKGTQMIETYPTISAAKLNDWRSLAMQEARDNAFTNRRLARRSRNLAKQLSDAEQRIIDGGHIPPESADSLRKARSEYSQYASDFLEGDVGRLLKMSDNVHDENIPYHKVIDNMLDNPTSIKQLRRVLSEDPASRDILKRSMWENFKNATARKGFDSTESAGLSAAAAYDFVKKNRASLNELYKHDKKMLQQYENVLSLLKRSELSNNTFRTGSDTAARLNLAGGMGEYSGIGNLATFAATGNNMVAIAAGKLIHKGARMLNKFGQSEYNKIVSEALLNPEAMDKLIQIGRDGTKAKKALAWWSNNLEETYKPGMLKQLKTNTIQAATQAGTGAAYRYLNGRLEPVK